MLTLILKWIVTQHLDVIENSMWLSEQFRKDDRAEFQYANPRTGLKQSGCIFIATLISSLCNMKFMQEMKQDGHTIPASLGGGRFEMLKCLPASLKGRKLLTIQGRAPRTDGQCTFREGKDPNAWSRDNCTQ